MQFSAASVGFNRSLDRSAIVEYFEREKIARDENNSVTRVNFYEEWAIVLNRLSCFFRTKYYYLTALWLASEGLTSLCM